MIIVIGTQFFEGKGHRYVDYPITDVLQMMSRACRPQHAVANLITKKTEIILGALE